jgi:hypothetical protein
LSEHVTINVKDDVEPKMTMSSGEFRVRAGHRCFPLRNRAGISWIVQRLKARFAGLVGMPDGML